MADDGIQINYVGLDEIASKLKAVGTKLSKYLSQAAVEVSKNEILATEGLKKYPPETAANQPPTPYYIRGHGTQYKSKNNGKSKNLGSRFTINRVPYGARIGNNASYAPHVIGENQARAMDKIGWRKLKDVAGEKVDKIKSTFTAWINKAMRDSGLK